MVNLKEYIHPNMDILFLALNAPEVSNANAHWFSRNLSFWNLLYTSGLINQQISDCMTADEIIFGGSDINYENMIFGVTDLNNELVQTDSRGVTVTQRHVNRILDILKKTEVSKLCLMHSTVGKIFRDQPSLSGKMKNQYGLIGFIDKVAVYEVPFHTHQLRTKKIIIVFLSATSQLLKYLHI